MGNREIAPEKKVEVLHAPGPKKIAVGVVPPPKHFQALVSQSLPVTSEDC